MMNILKIAGNVHYDIIDTAGEVVATRQVKNIIVETMLDNIIGSFMAEAGNPCSGFIYIGLGSGDTPETVNDIALENEFDVTSFGTSGGNNIYAERLSGFQGANYTANSYTVSGAITNNSSNVLSINESGVFNGATPSASGDEMACRTVIDETISLQPSERLNVTWTWVVSSA